MALPTTEVTVFPTSDLFRSNPGLLVPAFNQLRSKGVDSPIYSGLDAENPGFGFIAIHWDSYEHHQAVMAAPYYAELAQGLVPALAGPPQVFHVEFSAPAIALDKPITEIVFVTLKSPDNRAAVVDILCKISQASEKNFVFGQTREDENKYILACGWPTVEAHRETAAKPEVAAALQKLFSLADKDHEYHAKLTKY